MKLFLCRLSPVVVAALIVFLGRYNIAHSHCEIPCGIYGDTTRIHILYEHTATIEKSMQQIMALQKESPVNYNQLIRWVSNKEDHASKIQHIATQYFMTQRIKSANEKYIPQLTSMHGIMVHAMKAKQTTDVAHCKHLRDLVDKFSAAYFEAEDLKHIREQHGK